MNFQLNRSVAYTYSWRSTVAISLIVSAVFCFILVFLQPFDTYDVEMPYKNLKLWGYAIPVTLAILGIHVFENWCYNRQQKWFLLNELAVMVIGLLFITFLSFIYLNNVVNEVAVPWSDFFGWLKSYGLPFAPLLLVLWGYLRFRFSAVDLKLNASNSSETIVINTDSGTKAFKLKWNDFLFAEAQSNYVEIFTKSENENITNKTLIRSSLSKLISQLPRAVQTHRSYLINPDYIQKLGGNSRKGWCYIKGVEKTIPVSPKHFKALKGFLQNRP